MNSSIDPADLLAWCSIPPEQLVDHPQAKIRLRVLPTPEAVYREFALQMASEVRAANDRGVALRWILPCGPTGQYPLFAEIVNRERISLRQLHVFHMDELLDWQGRVLPTNHMFSFTGYMLRNFYGRLDAELTVPEEQRHFPDPLDIERTSQEILVVGGIDTAYGGIGYHGHIALNEPPLSPWYSVGVEEFEQSKTRIVHLNDDTIVALSQRVVGGCPQIVPPMAITLGMKDILGARRLRLFSTTGAWKQTVIRILLFGPMTTEYPVTLAQKHQDAVVTVDYLTASHPLSEGKADLL